MVGWSLFAAVSCNLIDAVLDPSGDIWFWFRTFLVGMFFLSIICFAVVKTKNLYNSQAAKDDEK